jgi:hypothetical protein
MKSLMLLLQQVITECGDRCGTSTSLDFKKVEERVENEGLEFLTITLPKFCDDFERSLANRSTIPTADDDQPLWVGYKKRGALPVFLGGLLDLIFDRESGRLLEDVWLDKMTALVEPKFRGRHLAEYRNEWWSLNEECTLNAVAGVRQITRLFSKIEIEASKERIDDAYHQFLQLENELKAKGHNNPEGGRKFILSQEYVDNPFYRMGESQAGRLGRIGRLLYGDVYTIMCTDLLEGHPVPRHGPGSTADRLVGNKKYEQRVWHDRLDRSFPAGEYLLPSWRYL